MQKRRVIQSVVVLIATAGIALAGYTYRAEVGAHARKAKAWFLAEKPEAATVAAAEDQHSGHGAPPGEPEGQGAERKVAYWYDSMNPSYKSDKPGNAPDGMKLRPKYEDEIAAAANMPPGTVMLSPDKQQLIGVRTAIVEIADLSRTLRTVGRIEADETKITHVHTKFEGWVEKVYVDFAGKLVRKGQPLFTIYSPELVSTQQEYLIALRGQKLLANTTYREVVGSADALLNSARERLKLWDVSEDQIARLEQTGETTRALTFNSPVDGYVTVRDVYENRFVNPDKELYTIVDLSSVWVNLDIYEYEAPYVRLGQKARMTLAYAPSKAHEGAVTYIYPTLDTNTRTLRVRMEFPNPELELKPGMYAEIELNINVGRHLQVPAEAVLDSGTRKVVFVAKPGGHFEPREIETRGKVDGRFIVSSGLRPGDAIVTSGNFLIDSESRLTASSAPAHHGAK